MSWIVTLLLLCVWGPFIGRALPIERRDNVDERSFKRELELFTNQIMDDWKLDDNEYLSRQEIQEENDALSRNEEESKRWLNVDLNKGLKKQSSPADQEVLPEDGDIFEGDIVMGAFVREIFNGEASKRDAVSFKHYYWPNRIVYYEFDLEIDTHSKKQIIKAIKQYHKFTCISFLPKVEGNGVKDYIRFISNGSSCYSNVGRIGGMQTVSIGSGCYRLGTPIHEIMHVLGFFHEMARPDRDENVQIHWENIKTGLKHNFKKVPESMDISLVPYNILSLMHYGEYAFSKNGKRTIIYPRLPTLHFGQRNGFSVGDIIEVNKLYNCTELNVRFQDIDFHRVIGESEMENTN